MTCIVFSNPALGRVVEYQFDVGYTPVNYTGKAIQAMTVGGTVPGPTIEASVGDILKVTFTNTMNVETSVHWHGILLPNDQDGVPYLTTPPIQPGTSFTYQSPVIHHGTYWYHSHTGLQEQRGVYGALVFHPKVGERVNTDHDVVVVLSDWTDENPNRVLHNLKKEDDYYALKKGAVQSWLKVFQHGSPAIRNRLHGAWSRMGPMDISDVGYDAFLSNGQRQFFVEGIEPGDSVRLRVINAAASSYFDLEFAGGPMTIVAADGVDVEPVKVQRQRIAIAETFDLVVTVPDSKRYEFRATAEDVTGFSSTFLGGSGLPGIQGDIVKAPDREKPNPFLMSHHDYHKMPDSQQGASGSEHSHRHHKTGRGGMKHAGHVDATALDVMAEYQELRSIVPTSFSPERSIRTVDLALTGDMERYAWSFNNKVLSESSKILIRKGEVVRFVLDNNTMMHHPLHLHGHFFRVLNGQGEHSPLKHTVNVPPMQTVTIEFLANEERDWFFHCHNLYHMKSGMSRVVSYADTTESTRESLKPLFADRHWFYFSDFSVQTNLLEMALRAENTRNALNLAYMGGFNNEYDIEFNYERSLNRFLQVYAGVEFEKEENELERLGVAGIHYLLPLLIEADIQLDSDGRARLQLSSDLQLTDRLSLEWEVDTDQEHHLALAYEVNKALSFVANTDDQYDAGVGVMLRF